MRFAIRQADSLFDPVFRRIRVAAHTHIQPQLFEVPAVHNVMINTRYHPGHPWRLVTHTPGSSCNSQGVQPRLHRHSTLRASGLRTCGIARKSPAQKIFASDYQRTAKSHGLNIERVQIQQ